MSDTLPTLKKGSHIHFMGICGTAMASLAGLLKQMGYHITGSDQNIYPPMSLLLERLQIPVMQGYKKENLNPKPDFVIVGNVITKKYEEAQALLASDIPYTSLPVAMGEWLIGDRKSFVVAGTHGKTTTTSLLAWVTDFIHLKPGFMIGGIPKNFDVSFKVPEGDVFVIEGDEYDTAFFDKVPKFKHYKPYYTVLGAIEFDHADIYKDINDVMKAFEILAEKSNPDGIFLSYAENSNTQKIASLAKSKNKISFGIASGDYQAKDIQYTKDATIFKVTYKDNEILTVKTQLFGEYNVLNALVCVALGHAIGWDLKKVAEALFLFKGVKRRQEIIGLVNGVTVIEDFAHHPTAVKMTIEAVKERFKTSRVHAVFEPRSATSRRKVFQKDYANAFKKADFTWLAKPYAQDAISEEDRFSSQELVKDIGKSAEVFDGVDEGVKKISSEVKDGDAVVIMSNGSFDGIYQKLLNALK
ncbi:MAG: UDP-N-acetylmuramate:L-alanyl-gamma-D-glutamyl-meso-diaminopimelate ligase [Bdellovibrionales bacterium]|nr:UDP-N-acetylmuramate:L-alanyl-gamma-D-glutamyl-meso-diaminopimelate ligase [Bdellovibrionales bacterium]